MGKGQTVFHIYRYARFERIKQLAEKNQYWYLYHFNTIYHSQTINQTNMLELPQYP